MRYRGLDDDLSRGPFPTLEFQKKQIRTIAAYKINIYLARPYFSSQHDAVLRPSSDGGLPAALSLRQRRANWSPMRRNTTSPSFPSRRPSVIFIIC